MLYGRRGIAGKNIRPRADMKILREYHEGELIARRESVKVKSRGGWSCGALIYGIPCFTKAKYERTRTRRDSEAWIRPCSPWRKVPQSPLTPLRPDSASESSTVPAAGIPASSIQFR